MGFRTFVARCVVTENLTGIEGDSHAYGRHIVEIKMLEDAVGSKQHHRIAVVDDVLRILRIELGKYGDDHGSIGQRCHVGGDPCR